MLMELLKCKMIVQLTSKWKPTSLLLFVEFWRIKIDWGNVTINFLQSCYRNLKNEKNDILKIVTWNKL